MYGIFGEKEMLLSIKSKRNCFIKYMNRTGFLNILVVILVVVIIGGIAGYFLFFQKQEPTSIVTTTPTPNVSQNTNEVVNQEIDSNKKPISSTLISFPKYDNGTFSIPAIIQRETEIILRWTSDKFLLGWGDKVYICLIALDAKKQVIERKENKELCYPDMQLILGTTTLSSGEYRWLSSGHDDGFASPPKSFKLSLRILDSLPPEGRSEWAGLISESTSNEFVIK